MSSRIINLPAADRILADLEAADGWVCGVTRWARESFILSFAQRISIDLKGKRGIEIESRRCQQHDHVKAPSVHEYRLVRKPEQLRINA